MDYGMVPRIDMNDNLAQQVIANLSPQNYLGEGSVGKVYRINYYEISAVAKVPVNETKKDALMKEIVIYSYICKLFNKCKCNANIVQMLGYNTYHSIIMLEYFDGSDLTKYTGYPVSESTNLTHRLLPRSNPGMANFILLGKYLKLLKTEDIIFTLFDHITSGIICLHSTKILHRDFELKNILIRSDGKIGITDFGVSKIIGKGETYDDFTQLLSGFKFDTDNLGPMMGDFIDSTNYIPYQYRLEKGAIDNISILDSIKDSRLSDAFLLLIEFPDLVAFTSAIYYMNLNTDSSIKNDLIQDAADSYNDSIVEDTELEENEREAIYIEPSQIENIMNMLYDKLKSRPSLTNLIVYFRLIIDRMMVTIGSDPLPQSLSVYEYLKQSFPAQQSEVIRLLVEQIANGFHLRNFDLFIKAFE